MKYMLYILSISLVLASCKVAKRDYDIQSNLEINKDYLTIENESSTFNNSETIKAWWSEFNDPVLDSLIEKARKNNLDINSAVANYYASRAFLEGTKFDRFPTVTSNGNFNRTRLGENVFVQGVNPVFNTFNGSFDAFWEADLFGQVSHRLKGAFANRELAITDMQGVYVSIFAEVAYNYFEIKGSQYLLDIAKRNLKGQQETYDLTVQLTSSGTSNSLDVSRALAQLENTRATIPPLEARLEGLKNSLNVLLGEAPGNLGLDLLNNQPLPDLPMSVSLGDVYEMLRRRPDVRRAEANLQVQIAQYNLSVAELYPKIQFGGNIGFSAIDFANFGRQESFTWFFMPSISWAAFNLGRVKQQIKHEDAKTFAAFNQFEKTILVGLEEIKTAMSNYTSELQRREILRKSTKASEEAATIARQRYNAGLDSFIDYLSADNVLLQSENMLARSEISSANSLIAIYKALGGGWEIIAEEELEEKINETKFQKGIGNR